MGQFKPMVKMMTTEPTVELKLKKGGHVNMKKAGKSDAGHKKMAMGGLPGGPVGGAIDALPMMARGAVEPAAPAPARPSMAARRAAMAARSRKASRMPMKEGGESKAEHKAEMSKMKGLEKELKSHESKPASKGHKGLKTGGVVNGQGGYKDGGIAKSGIINTEGQGGKYRDTLMHTAKPDRSPAKTGGVKNGNGGGYATGGVAKANGGGYKKGGAPKKAFAAGGTVDSGKPVAMPQGRKKPSTPVSINQLSGTFKKGGSVTPAEGRLQANFKKENATAVKQAKAQSNEKYSPYQKFAEGGKTGDMSKGAYDASKKHSMELEEALNPLSMVKELAGKAKDYFMPKGSESVTKTKESVTVTPGKKHGGRAC